MKVMLPPLDLNVLMSPGEAIACGSFGQEHRLVFVPALHAASSVSVSVSPFESHALTRADDAPKIGRDQKLVFGRTDSWLSCRDGAGGFCPVCLVRKIGMSSVPSA
jgi:hypothetical protein